MTGHPDVLEARAIGRAAAWLRSVVPTGFDIRLDGHFDVFVGVSGQRRMEQLMCGSLMASEPANELGWVLENLLSHVQDFVVEELRDVWPSGASSRLLPLPAVIAEDHGLRIGYKLGRSWIRETLIQIAAD